MLPLETSLKYTLDELQRILSYLPDEEYGRPLSILSDASIGQHTRHIIEFFQALINSYDAGVVNYDKRQRNRLLETDCSLAQSELIKIKNNISGQDKELVLIGSYYNDSHNETRVRSTYYREVVYNLEHTIHHMAMIKIGVRQTSRVPVPADFGVAPATIHYHRSK
jgi:hypothetical protein